jgi:hypothetical protein
VGTTSGNSCQEFLTAVQIGKLRTEQNQRKSGIWIYIPLAEAMERVQSEYYKTMTMPKPIVRTVYFPDLSPELQGELWVYNTIYDLGIGYALCIDSCPEHRPVRYRKHDDRRATNKRGTLMETSQSKKCVCNVTKEEYEAALAEIEKMQRHGGFLDIWAGHTATALEYEIAHGINPGSFPKAIIKDAAGARTPRRK